jgi:hypothetical protein
MRKYDAPGHHTAAVPLAGWPIGNRCWKADCQQQQRLQNHATCPCCDEEDEMLQCASERGVGWDPHEMEQKLQN